MSGIGTQLVLLPGDAPPAIRVAPYGDSEVAVEFRVGDSYVTLQGPAHTIHDLLTEAALKAEQQAVHPGLVLAERTMAAVSAAIRSAQAPETPPVVGPSLIVDENGVAQAQTDSRCTRCRNYGVLRGGICGTCADDMREDAKALVAEGELPFTVVPGGPPRRDIDRTLRS